MTARTVRLLPLAITKVDGREACVGAIDEDGAWVRPEPVTPADVLGPEPLFRYWSWTEVALAGPVVDDPRPEDRALVGRPAAGSGRPVPPAERPALLAKHCTTDVESAVGGARRTLGLVRARIEDLTVRRSAAGEDFFRCRFTDLSSATYDWIVPEIAHRQRMAPHVLDGRLDPDARRAALDAYARGEVFLTLGLTRPNNRRPNRFGGCHPLVVGVHAVDGPAEADR